MKNTVFAFLLSLAWLSGFSQPRVIDSLKQALALAQAEKDKVLILSDLSYEYLGSDTDSALLLAQQAHDLAQKINFTRGEARALFHLGHTWRILSDIPKSMQASLRGVQLAEVNGFRQEAALCNYNTGALYMDLLNDYPKALSYFKKAKQWNSPVQGIIGESCQLTLDINFGNVYEHLDMLDSSEFYYNEALNHMTIAPEMRPVILNFKGLLQFKLKNYPEALVLLRESIAKKLSHRSSAEIYFNLASVFRETGQTDSCIFYAKNSLSEAEQIGYQKYSMKSATLLAEVYEGENNPEALRFYKTAKLANDEVYGEQKVQDLQRIITEEMERQQLAEREKTAYRNRVRQLALLGGLGVVLLVAFLLYRNNRQKQKSNARLKAQNRELEIEAALERVRSRTMAMQKNEDLQAVVNSIFECFRDLKIEVEIANILIYGEGSNDMECWTSTYGQRSFYLPYNTDIAILNDLAGAKERGDKLFSKSYTVEEKNQLFEYFFEATDFKTIPDKRKKIILDANQYALSVAFVENVGVQLTSYSKASFSEHENKVLERFAIVFHQAYTRFLDLQKAEAQAREAQIEAALERVRASMMAMHRSDELRQVIGTMFFQLQSLGFDAPGSALIIYDKDGAAEHWMTGFSHDTYPQSYKVPYNEHPYFLDLFQAWQDHLPYAEFPFEGPAKLEYTEWALEHSEFKNLPDEFKQEMKNPARIIMADAFNKYGMVEIMTLEPLNPDKISILKRFSKVFEQTYTRFLDLQRAEAQAREAQIEAALERVRSRAIAMRHSDELSEAAELLYQEFLKFGVISYSCGYLINDDENGEWKIWLTNPGEAFFKQFWTIHYEADHNLKARYESWKRQEPFHCAVLEGEENLAHNVVISKYAPWKSEMLDSLPPRLVFNSAHFSLGHLLVISPDRLAPELEQAMVRFAKVFDLTYRRFLDLQKAETRAREAKIDAGLDRVRAEIASMRSTEDLEHITPLVWRELTALEVPFFRCGVFIMDEGKGLVHTYLSTPEGRSLAVIHLPFDNAETTRKTVEHWRKQKVYLDKWDKQQFIGWMQSLSEQGYLAEGNAYQGAALPPEALALHFVPFKQGMLYVGHSEELPEEQVALLQRLADTFAVAYARYEDFTKLEEAKNRVEVTLTELQSTQTQLIQSEKLASLGELTAGIAHEIQNPLNFVNNFSELSVDLAKDIQEEMHKPEIDQAYVDELLTDLSQNQQKINHHGKRAAAIVSGMLQHARASTGKKEPTDLNALADEYLRLAYHGLRAKDPNFNATLHTDFDPAVGMVDMIPQDMGRVLLNLINNAFYAVQQRNIVQTGHALSLPSQYEPIVTVSTQKTDNQIVIKIKDNGTGIPEAVKAKIFQPFFTTKPTGQGTGLGLSLAYDIVVKGHGGTLEVESTEGAGTAFVIQLPAF